MNSVAKRTQQHILEAAIEKEKKKLGLDSQNSKDSNSNNSESKVLSKTRPTVANSKSNPVVRMFRNKNFIFLLKRLYMYLIVAFLSLVFNFILPRMMPGDPATQMIQTLKSKNGGIPLPDAVVQQIYARYGEPIRGSFFTVIWKYLVAFWRYMIQTLHGNFGMSIQYYPVPVMDLIRPAIPWTIYLALTSTIIGWIIGTLAGAYFGWKPGNLLDTISTPFFMFISAGPAFWVGMLIVWKFGYEANLFPSSGSYDPDLTIGFNWPFISSVIIYSIMPLCTLVIVSFAGWMFSMRNMMITTVNDDYVQLARAKGLPIRDVRYKYAARNALLPNFTGLAQSIGGSLTAVVLAEGVFLYPGVGNLLGAAQGARDYPVMQTIMLMIIFMTLLFNFIADSVYVFLDPRTRES